jgi:DNA-binding NarL/FixJ family response regulator
MPPAARVLVGGVGLMAEGLPSRGVAARLGISYTTVRTHMRSLGSKLGVHSKLEAIVKAWELGLTT